MKKIVILQSNYIPWKGYFDLVHDADAFVFYDEVKYTKNDWRNRNKIYTSNGIQWLSIPINKDAVKQKISEVEINDNSWQELHYKSLFYGYKNAPFFAQLEEILKEVYLEMKWNKLSDLNRYLIKKISGLLNLSTTFLDSKDYEMKGERVDRLINLLKDLQAGEYISGPAAKEYLDGSEHLFAENNIRLTYKNYPDYPHYKQLCEPFRHDVSIFDLIANVRMSDIPKHIWNY